MSKIVLASTSPFRQQLLQKLHLKFETSAPDIDESPLSGEDANALVARLAQQKATAVAQDYPNALIIGSDQVALLDSEILGKPVSHENAIKQLLSFSGNCVTFLTGLALHNSSTGKTQVDVVPFKVYFRPLNSLMVEHYLLAEKPYNCAGSFKSEGFGIALFSKLEGDDPNTLIGLPLIRLTRMLEAEGVWPLGSVYK